MVVLLVNEPTKIAFTGKLRSGKTEAARYLELYHDFERLSFGAALKRNADELFDGYSTYPSKEVEYGAPCPFTGERPTMTKKPRKRYVDFGQMMRQLDPDIWVRHLAFMYEHYVDSRSTVGIVIDDLRQPNEYEWLRKNGFVIVRVNANEDTRIERAKAEGDDFTLEDLRHSTELYVDDFEVDYDIWNDGEDISELERKVDEIVAKITEGAD